MSRFSDKEKQLFWNLKFHAVLSFIDNLQPNNSNVKLLQCYDISLTSLNLTCTKGKTNLNSVMIKHIRDHSRHPSTLQVRNWRRDPGITSPYAKTQDCRILEVYILEVYIVVYIIVCSEKSFGENRITQETVHRFALQINLLVPASQTFPPEVIPMKSGN